MEVMRATCWATNAEMIADVARLGYIEGNVLDATYGHFGGFWTKFYPADLTTNDRYAPNVDYQDDFRKLRHPDRSFTTVVYDPPYKLNGTPDDDVMDHRFGTDKKMTIAERLDLIYDGAVECWRVADKWLLVKCMDQVVSGRMVWQTIQIHNLLVPRGARLADRFDFINHPRPQRYPQKHARSNYSTLLVFTR